MIELREPTEAETQRFFPADPGPTLMKITPDTKLEDLFRVEVEKGFLDLLQDAIREAKRKAQAQVDGVNRFNSDLQQILGMASNSPYIYSAIDHTEAMNKYAPKWLDEIEEILSAIRTNLSPPKETD